MAKRTRIGVPSEQDVREQLLVTADVLLEAGQYDRAKRLQQWAETTYALQAPVYRVLARLVNQHARKPDGPAAARIVSIEQ